MTNLDLLTKRELNQLLPEDQRWTPDQLKRLRRGEILQEVQSLSTAVAPIATIKATTRPEKGPNLIPMQRLSVRNKDQITSAARDFFESRGVDYEAWNFVTNKYSDDRGTRLEIAHVQLGLVQIYWTTKGYVLVQ